jgi:tetratricopeptide (TPR) repeat protein
MNRAVLAGHLALLAVVLAFTLVLGPAAAATQKPPQAPSLKDLEAAVARDPADPGPYVDLGIAYLRQGDQPRALETLRRAVEVGPRLAEAHNWLGVALAEKSDLPGAIAAFRKAIELDPKHGRAYANLGSALAKAGDYAAAVKVFEKALALEPESPAAHYNLGMALREKGDLEAALRHLQHVIDADPTNARVHYEVGQTLRQSGDLVGAVASLEKAIEIDPELREGYYGLALALRQKSAAARRPQPRASPADAVYQRAEEAAARGDLAAAREALTEALRLDEGHADAHSLMGFVLGQQRELEKALAHLERAIALAPQSAQARYNLGVALWYSGSRDRALSELRQAVALDPAAGDSHAFLGTALREMGDLAAARASLQRAIALLPPTAAVYIDLGITYLRAGDLDKALGQLEAGLNLPPPALPTPDWPSATASLRQALAGAKDRADAHNVLGLLLGRESADSAAVAAEFREAIRLRPDFAEAHNNLGLVLLQKGEDQPAIAAFREAVRLAPDYADARANLGAALTPTDIDEAILHLEKAVALAPTLVKARFNLAAAYAASPKHGRPREIEQLRKAIDLAPSFARAHLALGKALLQEGQVTEAVSELEQAVRLEPERGESQYQLGLALARAGRKEEAAAALEKGRAMVAEDERAQNANLDVVEGRSALEKGDLEQAVAKLRRAVQVWPDAPEAHRVLGEALEKKGDLAGASAAYHKALELAPADASAREGLERLAGIEAASDDSGRVAELEGYIRESRFAEVEPLLAQYVKQRPRSSWGWYALGYSRFAQQKIGESIQALAKSLELDVRNAEAHKILGRALMIIGRFDAAQVEFEQGIKYKPDSAEMHYNLGKLFSIQDNWEPARKALQEAVRLDPSYLPALDALGFALEALGDDAGAVASYEKAVALNRDRQGRFVSAHVNLSAYYNRLGDPEKALAYAREALLLDPRSDAAWFQQARALERQGKLAEAVDALGQAISINGRASSYQYVLAGLYRRLGKTDESQAALESFKRLEREASELETMRRRENLSDSVAARPPG